jgi:Ion channel
MSKLNKKLQQFWAEEKSLTILLLILVLHIFVIIPFGQQTLLQKIIFLIFYAALLSAGAFLLTKNITLRIVTILIVVLLVLMSSDILFTSPSFEIADDFIIGLYCILLSWIVLLRTFGAGPITIHRIQGAVVVYLLIALIFASLYHSIFLMNAETAFKGLGSADRKEFMYFSLTTLTTVGYGDISAALASGRSLANLEGLLGQLYPAILIARLVSMEFESSKENKMK